jgi:hypothetical protein
VVDPLSLSVLGGMALTEGIKFLYGQATELLKCRRDRVENSADPQPVSAEPPTVLDGPLAPKPVDLAVVDANEDRLRELRRALGDYVDGLADINPADKHVLSLVAALRSLLELAYGQHLTFRGEHRPVTGSPLPAQASAEVANYVATVNVSGAGAVGIGRDNTGSITTTHNPGPAAAGSPTQRP